MGVATIQIGGEATPWEKVYAISISAVDDERPRLVLNNLTELASLEDGGTLSPGQRAWIKLTDTAIDRSPDKDIIIFFTVPSPLLKGRLGRRHSYTIPPGRILWFCCSPDLQPRISYAIPTISKRLLVRHRNWPG